ncbi:uncharacterized protein LOC129222772 isoform X2 [Uloborus diversus]|nr:uncharacterized protein LOC129222772 isoform X2 [Uloborus diversus]
MASKLTDENLFECLKSLSVPLRKQDVTNPTKELMIRVFECFLKDLQIDVTNQALRPWNITQHMKEPEIYEDVLNLTLMVLSINHIFDPIRMKIAIRDIAEPKPKRTKKILNFLIIFWNFYLKRLATFHTIELDLEEEQQHIDSMITQIEAIDEKQRELSSVLENMEPCADELLSCNVKKKEKIRILEEKQAKIKTEYYDLKTGEVELKNKISATCVDIASAKEKLDDLRQLILSSPDRFKSEIQKLQEDIKSMELKIKNKEKELKDWEKKLEDAKKTQENYSKALAVLQKTDEELQQLCKQVQDYLSDMQKLSEKEESVKELESNIERKSEVKAIHEQNYAKVKLNNQKHQQSLDGMFEEIERETQKEKTLLESSKEIERKLLQNIESLRETLLQMREKHKRVDSEAKQKISNYKTKTRNLKAEFCADINELAEQLKKKL